MKEKDEVKSILSMSYKELEFNLGLKIRNGQSKEAIIKTINWVLSDPIKTNEVSLI